MFLLVTFLIEFEVYITVNSSLCCIIVIQLEYVFLTLNATFYLILILLINFFFIYYFILTRKIQRRKCNLRCNFELNKVLILFRIQFIQLCLFDYSKFKMEFVLNIFFFSFFFISFELYKNEVLYLPELLN